MNSVPYLAVPLSLCALLGACSAEAPATAAATAQAAPVAPAQDAAMPASATPAAAATSHRFAFNERSATPGASGVEIVGAEPTPCGPVLIARVDRIPLDDPRVAPDRVVEFDAAGQQVRSWGVPYEAVVTAVDGERVQFRTDTGTYWTDAAGTVEQADANGIDPGAPRPPTLVDAGAAVECPSTVAAKYADMQCAAVRDVAGQERRLAVETVCS